MYIHIYISHKYINKYITKNIYHKHTHIYYIHIPHKYMHIHGAFNKFPDFSCTGI